MYSLVLGVLLLTVLSGQREVPTRAPPPHTCNSTSILSVSVYYEIDEFTLIYLIPVSHRRVHSSFLFSVFVSSFSTVRNMAPFILDTFTYMINLSVTNLSSYHFPLPPVCSLTDSTQPSTPCARLRPQLDMISFSCLSSDTSARLSDICSRRAS